MDELKGVNPAIASHQICLEEGAQLFAEFQRILKPQMKEVVRKEIIRPLDIGIIYHVKENNWVCPVHCVPKKGGFTVVANEHNELIPTRTIVAHRMYINYRNWTMRRGRITISYHSLIKIGEAC
jgi:hypothetical protein